MKKKKVPVNKGMPPNTAQRRPNAPKPSPPKKMNYRPQGK